jgi:plasmid stabilization system protein ParE
MAYEVIYKKRFNNKLIKLLQYLKDEWSEKTASGFLKKIDERIETLKQQPFIGKPSERKPEVRTILITKHNRLYYKFSHNKIIVLNMYDTRRNPEKNHYSR